jgi:hypothetical protein
MNKLKLEGWNKTFVHHLWKCHVSYIETFKNTLDENHENITLKDKINKKLSSIIKL